MDRERDDVRLQPFSTLVEREYDYSRPRRGEVRKAVVLSVSENEVIVDLGAKRDGFVPHRDLDLLDEVYRNSLQVGDHVSVYVLDASGPRGEVVVSLNKGLAQEDWLRAKEYLESGDLCRAEVTAVNQGGVIVPFGRLRGFVPNSQLTSLPRGMRRDRLEQARSNLIGRVLSLVMIEVNRRQRRLVLSERAASRRLRQQLLSQLTEGEVRTGVVCHLVEFGAFVDLGGVDGLIHISELDWRHVTHPSEVLGVGDEVEVYVLSVDRERGRIGLSRKRLLPDPWPIVIQRLRAGQTAEGTVTHIAPFGVFVDLGRGVEGLIHTSEMPNGKASAVDLRPGSPITVRVLRINRWRRRIALSLRHLPQVGFSSRLDRQVSEDHPPVWRV